MKKLIIAFILASSFFALKAQEYTYFYDSLKNKLYYNKELPVYFWVSTSPDSSGQDVLLKSFSTPQYANPYYFDTEGKNTFRVKGAKTPSGAMAEAVFEIYADGLAPKIIWNVSNGYRLGNKVYYGSGSILNVKGEDLFSGVKAIYYSINDSDFVKLNGPLKFDKEGLVKIKFYAIDKTGNKSGIKTAVLNVDLSAPEVKLTFTGKHTDSIASRISRIKFLASDTISGVKAVYYSIDNRPFIKYYKPVTLYNFKEGEHLVKYYAEDFVGNKTNQLVSIILIDNTPPDIDFEFTTDVKKKGRVYYVPAESSLKLVAEDNLSGVQDIHYIVNGKEKFLYDGPIDLMKYQRKFLKITFYATDKVGNKSVWKIVYIQVAPKKKEKQQ